MSDKKKNVLFITSDQQHWHTIGKLNPQIKTPNLDRLADDGTLFTRAYTVNPTCTPTRASWITGTYPSQNGAYTLGTKLMEDVPVVGDEFQKGSVKTALIGKAHFQPLANTEEYSSLESYPILQDLDFWKNYKDRFYGFDSVELARNHTDEAHVGQHYALWLKEKGCENWKDYFLEPTGTKKKSKGKWDIPAEFHYNNWITEKTNEKMEEYSKNGDQFYVWASFFDPHPTYLVPEPWASMYDPATLDVPEAIEDEHRDMPPHFGETQRNEGFSDMVETEDCKWFHGIHYHVRSKEERAKDMATYYGMVTMMDEYIGKILDKLDELGLTEDTLVVFTTDHGHFFGQHGLVAKGPFHYEDMIKVPLIARMPGQIPAGVQSDALQSTVDVAPTFLSYAGLKVPRYMTGQDMRANWNGDTSKNRKHVLVENRHQPGVVDLKTMVTDQYKITIYNGREYGELFDLQNDPGEYTNLWNSPEHQTLKCKLFKEFIDMSSEIEALPMPRIAGA